MAGFLSWFRGEGLATQERTPRPFGLLRRAAAGARRSKVVLEDRTTLRADGIICRFGDKDAVITALDGVGIDLYRGQLALLMGPSGSGKSTLLAVLSGLQHPTEGTVDVLGQDLWQMSEPERERFRLKHFGFIFQGYNLFPALTARQQLELILRWGERKHARFAREKTDAMLERLGLTRQANLRPIQMSGGEKQRVAIGRALIKEPTFCFADEPTSALDWNHGKMVIETLRDTAHQHGATMLVVSHDPRLVPYADRVWRLDDGRIA